MCIFSVPPGVWFGILKINVMNNFCVLISYIVINVKINFCLLKIYVVHIIVHLFCPAWCLIWDFKNKDMINI